jgi:hypothetical protein
MRGRPAGRQPGSLDGHLDQVLPGRSNVRVVKDHAALDWRQADTSMAELSRSCARCGRNPVRMADTPGIAAGEVKGR